MKLIILSLLILLTGCQKEYIPEIKTNTTVIETTKSDNDNRYAGEYWYDMMEVVNDNTLKPRSFFYTYKDKQEAILYENSALDEYDGINSSNVISLNGDWNFYYANNVDKRLKQVFGKETYTYNEDWDTSNWDIIHVPSNIQTIKDNNKEFKYEKPHYVNNVYPWSAVENISYGWQGQPLATTTNNSVGHYKRNFELTKQQLDKNIYLNFQGVESAFYLYINGQYVGYSEDSYTQTEFDITSYLKEGTNTIAVEVYHYSDASYFENQDFIRFSGIFRDVFLQLKEDIHVYDYTINANTSNIDISIDNINKYNDYNNLKYKITLLDNDYNIIKEEDILINNNNTKYNTNIDNPILWSAEKPYLYNIIIELIQSNNVLEVINDKIGIREIKVSTNDNNIKQILINNKPIMLKGVNRHETSITNGRAITKQEILNDLIIMKSFNINAIRTSHYPNNVLTYDIANEIGLYIIDEANIETHAGEVELNVPSNNPIYNNIIMDRTINMYQRDKNNPSIIIWSLGNESTYKEYEMNKDYPFYNSSMYLLNNDPNRLRVYERDNRINNTREESMVDIYSTQYWSIDQIKDYVKNSNEPYFQSEYAHAMGNGIGNLKEYYDLFYEYDNLQGGFIWDFIDQSVLTRIDNQDVFGYGGDWNNKIHDKNFLGNGLLNADRTISDELYEVKHVQQGFNFKLEDNNIICTNNNLFTNLNEYNLYITYTYLDMTKETIKLNESCKPLEDTILNHKLKDNNVSNILLEVKRNKDELWAHNNYGYKDEVVAHNQFIINEFDFNKDIEISKLDIIDNEDYIEYTNDEFTISFNKTNASINKYIYKNNNIINDSLGLNFYRAELDNDPIYSSFIKDASNLFNVTKYTIKNNTITFYGKPNTFNKESIIKYTITNDGNIQIDVDYNLPKVKYVGDYARVGIKFKVNESFNKYSYYGLGPHDNYSDRNTSAIYDLYSFNTNDVLRNKYLKPQDFNNKSNVDKLILESDNINLNIYLDKANINISHYDDTTISTSRHWDDIEVSKEPIIRIDTISRGIGNNSYGPIPLDKYLIKDNKYKLSMILEPIIKK